ncbi:MAG: hypothetical protein ACFB51_20435, partial [Anaerolineae bacterium]
TSSTPTEADTSPPTATTTPPSTFTATPTFTLTPTRRPTNTPRPTNTNTPTVTPSNTPTNTPDPADTNRLDNGGFESGSTADWSLANAGDSGVIDEQSAPSALPAAAGGRYYFAFTSDGTADDPITLVQGVSFNGSEDDVITLDYTMRTVGDPDDGEDDTPPTCQVSVQLFENNVEVGSPEEDDFSGTNNDSWSSERIRFTADADFDEIGVTISCAAGADNGADDDQNLRLFDSFELFIDES